MALRYTLPKKRNTNEVIRINPQLWAKKQDRRGRYEWLPLYVHLEETGQVAGLLWEHWLSEGQKNLIRGLFEKNGEEQGKALVQFIASIHDVGKATPAFQKQKGFTNTADLDTMLLEKLESAGFTGIASLPLASAKYSPHALAGQRILHSLGIRDDIASIIGAHHGKPVDYKETVEEQRAYDKNYFQSDDARNPMYEKWKQTQKEIVDWAMRENGFSSVEDLPKISQPAQVILSGLLIMADWIASNELYFPLISVDENQIEDRSSRIQEGWMRWKKTELWQPDNRDDIPSRFEKRFGFAPRRVQERFARLIEETEKPGIIILEAPMGLGKTEAALVAVEQLAEKSGRSGMFFGLPTQATSNGIFPRIRSWLEGVQSETADTASIRLAHGKAALNQEFSSLATNINTDEGQEASVIVNNWFAGRKTSALDDFVVGTVDHFLLLALKQKHLFLRHLGFSKKIVVIDEVHAYDAYMNQYLLRAIRWMAAYDVPVVILSATLPAQTREKMLRAYLLGKGVRSRNIRQQLDVLEKTAYPLVSYTDGASIRQYSDFGPMEETKIIIRKKSSEELQNLLDDLTRYDGIIGIIVNTVKRAQELARECSARYGEENVALLHARFIDTDRIKKEDELIKMIGKNEERPRQKIIIGTQVIEQSLDIDLDVLISDLAPMDLLIQRIGRLHRHKRPRPKAHEMPVCYVLDTSESFDFQPGSVAVYGEYLLARTQYFLKDKIHLPREISELVQRVYSETAIDLEKEQESRYQKMREEHFARLKTKENKAKTYQIGEPVLTAGLSLVDEDSLIGWLHNRTPNESEEYAHAQVRDVQETLEVIALKRVGNGYGLMEGSEDLSMRIDDREVAQEIARQTLRLPSHLSAHYAIDKTIRELEEIHNNYFRAWHNQPWLKGALGILFDENNQCELNRVRLHYDGKYGLEDERM